jgi:hypothetical protein
MKGIIYILLFILLIPNFLFAQEQTGKDKGEIIIGFNTGMILSKFSGIDYDNSAGDLVIANKNKINPGITVGGFVSLPFTNKHFSIRAGVDYSLIRYSMNYYYMSDFNNFGGGKKTNVNYSLNASIIKLSFLPAFEIGKKIKTCFQAGPYLDIPIGYSIKGSITENGNTTTITADTSSPTGYLVENHPYTNITENNKIKTHLNSLLGFIFGVGLTIPCSQNAIGIEMKAYICPMNFSTDLQLGQNLISLCITYQFK